MKFNPYTMERGSKIVVPHSRICKEEGEIIYVAEAGITVKYEREDYEQITFYSYEWLEHHYGAVDGKTSSEDPPFDDPIPF